MEKLTIDINGACNLDCTFCYQTLDGSTMPLGEIFGAVDTLPDAGLVEIGGGEPLMHKHIISLLQGLAERAKRMHVATNATFLPEGLLDLEDTVRTRVQMQVSLHASTPSLYEKITGKDMFDTVIGNALLLKEKYTTSLTMAVYDENVHDVPHVVRIARGLVFPLRVNLVMPVHKGKDVTLLDAQQIDSLKGYLLTQYLVSRNQVDSPLIHLNNCAVLEQHYGIQKHTQCPIDSGAKTYISPQGMRSRCEFYGGEN